MKLKTLPLLISALFATSPLHAETSSNNPEQQYFKTTYESIYTQINNKLEEIRTLASDEKNIIQENGKRYISVNGLQYEVNAKNYPIIPLRHWSDESYMRNLFDFISNDWELTMFQGGMVAVNKLFGNYDYDNGCLIEYFPKGTLTNNGLEHLVIETSSCSVNNFDSEQSILERVKKIKPEQVNLTEFSSSAVEIYKDKIYVSQDTNVGYINVFDANTLELTGTIQGAIQNGTISPYKRITEISKNNNLLYVSSLSSNRVDIFDMDNNDEYVMSLGNGSWSGQADLVLVHAQAVAANNEYVVVKDITDKISIYLQDDVKSENSFKLKKHAYLQFENQNIYASNQMHIIDNYLIVNTSNKNYYVYDLKKVAASVASGERLQPEKVVANKISKIDLNKNTFAVHTNNKISYYDAKAFIANDFIFEKELNSIAGLDKANTNFRDLKQTDDKLVTLNKSDISVYNILSNKVKFLKDQKETVSHIQFDSLMPTSISYILGNDESFETLTNPELRSVNINSLVKTEFLENNTVKITNYAAKELKDINIELKVNGINKWFTLTNIDKIPAYAQISISLDQLTNNGRLNSVNNDGVFELHELFNSNADLNALLSYRFNSTTDEFAQTLSRLKPSWRVTFAKNNDAKWVKMNPVYAREWLVIMTNLAYMVSQDEFKHVWFNFEKIYGYNMNGPAGTVNKPDGYFTPEDYQYYYNGLMLRDYVNLGVTIIGGGLGSNYITGVDTWMFYTHYYGSWGIIAHEFGHGFDGKKTYHHETSFANGSNGWHPLITELANYHIRKGDLPYMDDNITATHKAENAKYLAVGVDHKMRKHRSNLSMNRLDEYFMTFSNMPQGWFKHTPEFTPDALNNQERMMLSTLNINSKAEYVCRFNFTDDTQQTTLHGYVEQLDDNQFRCTGGKDISYRKSNGVKVNFQSPINQFEWLSSYNEKNKKESITTYNGKPLCSLDTANFYGVGFVNEKNQCVQQPEVYWSNGVRWVFSSSWIDYRTR